MISNVRHEFSNGNQWNEKSGYVAATGRFGIEPGTLFAVQFMWQFPHFWAIAWVAHEDYLKAGYKMLPFIVGRTAASARQILLYTMLCIPASLLPWALPGEAPMVGDIAFTVAVLTGLGFLIPAVRQWRSLEVKDARQQQYEHPRRHPRHPARPRGRL